jgi:hypothetical protein
VKGGSQGVSGQSDGKLKIPCNEPLKKTACFVVWDVYGCVKVETKLKQNGVE